MCCPVVGWYLRLKGLFGLYIRTFCELSIHIVINVLHCGSLILRQVTLVQRGRETPSSMTALCFLNNQPSSVPYSGARSIEQPESSRDICKFRINRGQLRLQTIMAVHHRPSPGRRTADGAQDPRDTPDFYLIRAIGQRA